MIRGRGFEILITLTCSYELIAIFSHGTVPTITTLDRRTKRHVIAGLLLIWLGLHFLLPEKITLNPKDHVKG